MKIEEVMKLLDFIFGTEEEHIRYSIIELDNKISCLCIKILNKEWNEWSFLKELYFENGKFDPNYNRKIEIENEIERLQKELKNLQKN